MGYTSTEVKRRYNDKTYKRFVVDFRIEEFDEIEAERNQLGMSRAEFICYLIEYRNNTNGTRYVIRDREAGNPIATFSTRTEAEVELRHYEAEDKRDGTYEDNFYEIVEE